MLPPVGLGDGFMSKAQWLGLLYGAIAVLGAAYGVFGHQHAVADSMKEVSLPLIKEFSDVQLIETAFAPIPVSLRTRFATRKA